MTLRTKQILLIFLSTVLVGILLLSASLTGLKLQAGTPFPGSGSNQSTDQAIPFLVQTESRALPVLEVVLAVLLLSLMIYVPAKLIGLVNLRNALRLILAALLLLVLVGILPRVLSGKPAIQTENAPIATDRPSFEYPVSPLGEPPPIFAWLAAGGVLLGVSLLTMQFLRRKPKPANTTDALLQEAEEALHALRAGKDFSNVIIRCYLQMTEVLRSERSFERRDSMTVREFQDWLELKGIPAGPVHQLTSLFEKARYSKEQIDKIDEETGANCLEQIVQYCRKAKTEGVWTSA
jgi:hypothetical protein